MNDFITAMSIGLGLGIGIQLIFCFIVWDREFYIKQLPGTIRVGIVAGLIIYFVAMITHA